MTAAETAGRKLEKYRNTPPDGGIRYRETRMFDRIKALAGFSAGFASLAPAERADRIDPGAARLLRLFIDYGKEAYIVGGCVRDLAMGLVPHDWDITTSARPEETMEILQAAGIHAVDGGGRRYGTVIAVTGGASYEITTFRREFYGEDAHRPEGVSFADTLEEDLSRRDFTVNAMALSGEGVLIDPYGGMEDIRKKKLRTVGESSDRFQEDALRLFRACRFLGQLDFMADPSLVSGMKSAFPRVAGLSLERVRTEVEKLLVTAHAPRGLDLLVRSGLGETSCRIRENGTYEPVPVLPELSHLVGLPQMKQFHKYDGWYHTLAVVDAAPRDRIDRWAALLHDVGKGMPGVRRVEGEKITDYNHDHVGAEMAEALLLRWRLPEREVRLITWLVKEHMKFHYFANVDKADVMKWVRHMARNKEFPSQEAMIDGIRRMTALSIADIIGCGRPFSAADGHTAFGQAMEAAAESIPVTTKELHYDRRTIDALGPVVAEGMQNLLSRVQNGVLPNEADALAAAAGRYRKRHGHENS